MNIYNDLTPEHRLDFLSCLFRYIDLFNPKINKIDWWLVYDDYDESIYIDEDEDQGIYSYIKTKHGENWYKDLLKGLIVELTLESILFKKEEINKISIGSKKDNFISIKSENDGINLTQLINAILKLKIGSFVCIFPKKYKEKYLKLEVEFE